jgi:fucose 4-O-acetylase-like acetyltransferase
MAGNVCGNIIYFLLGSIYGIAMIVLLSLKIKNNKLLSYLGKNSLLIMCVHYFSFLVIGYIIQKVFGINIADFKNNIIAILQATITIISIIPIIYIVNKKFKFILGKF